MLHTSPTDASTGHTTTPSHVHVVPRRVLASVFATLVALTFITVALAQVPTGPFEIWIAIGIASVKAALDCGYFMHLRYDKAFNTLLLLSSLAFVALFLLLTLGDAIVYFDSIEPP